MLIDENTASKEFSFADFFSKNPHRIVDQGAIMEIFHVPDKCDRSNWSAVLKTILSCKSIFGITKLSFVSKLSRRSGRLTRGSCMAIICLSYSLILSCSWFLLDLHFMFSIKMTFLPRLPWCCLPGRRVSSSRLVTGFFERCSCLYATSPRKKHSRRFSYQKGFLARGFRSKVTRHEKVTGPLLCEEGERGREKCLARI